jgi:uncharacterized protein involved in exopolysaccharide biosynthesis
MTSTQVQGPEPESDWRNAVIRRTLAVAAIALHYRWLLVLPPLIAGLWTMRTAWRMPTTYTATARFMTPSGRTSTASALGSQLGLNLGGVTDAAQNPDFYVELLTSRSVLEQTARAKYPIADSTGQTEKTLEQAYGGMDAAVAFLKSSIGTPTIAPRTGIITVSATAPSPILAQRIAEELLKALDNFNRQRRQSRAAVERKFTEGQLAQADSVLHRAEDNLMNFYQRNRGFERSPELRFEEQRLSREVAQRQQLRLVLAQSYEQAKIDEVRDTPVLTILEDPLLPKNPNGRARFARAANAMVFAVGGAALLVALLGTFGGVKPDASRELQELRASSAEALQDLRHPLRVFRRSKP